MCRHLLPRFDLPVAQMVHSVGRLVVAHPTFVLGLMFVPLCAALSVLAWRHLRRPASLWWTGPRTGLAGRTPTAIDGHFGIARSG